MSYIGTEPKDIRSFGRTKFDYTATQGQTAFTGADDDGKVLAFTVGQIEVYVNGILMDDSDFTTTGTGTVTLASAANLNDVVNVVSFETNIPDSNYVPASGGTFTGNITASGTLGVTGAVTASNGLTVDDAGATPLTVDRATSDGTIIDVQKDGTSVATIGNSGSAGIIILNKNASSGVGLFGSTNNGGCLLPTNNTTAVDNAKDLGRSDVRWRDIYLSGGLMFGSNSAHALDDYEEGTYNPTINCGSGSITLNSSFDTYAYTKIGNKVTVTGLAVPSAVSSPSGTLEITLPFTSANSTEFSERSNNIVSFWLNGSGVPNGAVYYNAMLFLLQNGLSYIKVYLQGYNGAYSTSPANWIGVGSDMHINFTYFAA